MNKRRKRSCPCYLLSAHSFGHDECQRALAGAQLLALYYVRAKEKTASRPVSRRKARAGRWRDSNAGYLVFLIQYESDRPDRRNQN
jgi:hypothetical protein